MKVLQCLGKSPFLIITQNLGENLFSSFLRLLFTVKTTTSSAAAVTMYTYLARELGHPTVPVADQLRQVDGSRGLDAGRSATVTAAAAATAHQLQKSVPGAGRQLRRNGVRVAGPTLERVAQTGHQPFGVRPEVV